VRKKSRILAVAFLVATVNSSAHAAPTMTRAFVDFAGFIGFDGQVTATPLEHCWTAYDQSGALNDAIIVQGARTIVEPVQFWFGGCGTETLTEGSGSVWSLSAISMCGCVVDLYCPPPPAAPCGTYTRSGGQLSVTINNVFVKNGPTPIEQTTGPYSGLTFKGRVVNLRDFGSPPSTMGELVGSLSYAPQ
jgi:hypothetical protein